MNVAYYALAATFSALAAAMFARSRKAASPTQARNSRIAGVLFILSAAGFIVAGIMIMGTRS